MTVWFDAAKGFWRYDFRHHGTRHAKYCIHPDTGAAARNRTEAKAIETIIRARVARDGHAPAIAGTYTLAQAMAAHLAASAPRASFAAIKDHVAAILAHFGPDMAVVDVTREAAEGFARALAAAPKRVWIGGPTAPPRAGPAKRATWKSAADGRTRSPATVNRHLNTLRAALNRAHKTRDPGDHARALMPVAPDIPRVPEPRSAPRPFTADELERLIAAAPAHLADALRLGALTGLRHGEIHKLTIAQIDDALTGIWLKASETKAKRGEFVPLGPAARALVARLIAQARARHQTHLITYRPRGKKSTWRPIISSKAAWIRARREAGLEDRRFHQTKATFVTAILRVTDIATAQRLARHKSSATTQAHYAGIDPNLAAAVEAAEATTGRLATAPAGAARTAPSPTQEFHTGRAPRRLKAVK